jgi:gliding motility-associated-like protein
MNLKITLATLLALACTLSWGQNYLMNANLTSISDCEGFFLDSGGGTNNYGPNQNFTTIICPDLTTGTHVQLVFSGTQLGPGDELCFFDGQNTGAPSLGCAADFGGNSAFIIQATAVNASGCLTVTFTSDAAGQGAGWSADINCIPACQTIMAVLDKTDPLVVPADTGWIDICPGDRVFFWGKGQYPQNGSVYNHSDLTSDFEWDFGDGVNTLGPNVSHVFEEPGGYVVQMKITDQFGCTNNNFISQRIRVAPRPNFELGDWTPQICAGDTVRLNAVVDSMDNLHTVSVMGAEAGFQTAGIRSDSLALPDGNGSSYETTISFTGFQPGQLLTNINDLLGIFVNMEHSWMRDLQIKLSCPNGQSVLLHNHPGQTGGEVFLGIPYEADEGFLTPVPGTGYDYGWSANPGYNYTWIQYANAFAPGTLPTGTYKSFESLDSLLGCPLNGDWTIEVTDLWAIDNGYIFSWSIDFNPDLYPDIEMFSPQLTSWEWNQHPSIFYAMPDSIAGSPVNAGEVAYTFTVHDEFGCAWDTIIDIKVLPFTHPDCHTCQDILKPENDTTVCQGEPVALDVLNPIQNITPVTFESYDNYPIGAGNHPPANPYNSVININSINPASITNAATDIVSVCLDLKTDFDADINIFLVSPNNQVLMLSTNNGGSGDNYTQTCFTPTATTPITAGTPPFTGNFLPEGNWSILNGVPINGNWKLRISDAFGLNAMGNLNWWSITFNSKNNVTYTWTPPGGLSCTNCPAPTATPTVNTNYIVTALDSYGCVSKDTVSINVLNSFTAPTVSLQSGAGEMTATWNDISPGLTYEVNVNNTGWMPSNNGNLSHIISGLTNGAQVSVQVRVNVNGVACQVGVGTAALTYFYCPINAVPTNPGPYAVSCNGLCDAAVQITVQNGQLPYTFNITNQTTGNQFTQADSNLVNLCAGTFVVIVEDGGGCLDTVNFTVNNKPAITVTATATSPTSCNGSSDGCATVSATGGAGGFTYVWNNPNMSTQQSICTLPAGPITVTATDMTGCQSTASVTITQPPVITLTTTKSDAKCKGGATGSATVTATGGVGGFTYQWSGGTTPTAATTSGLSANTYSVTVTDANGCQAFANVTVGEPATGVTTTLTQTVTSCFGQNLSEASATATGGSGPYTFQWSPSNQTTAVATNLAPGVYTVTATDAGGCTATKTITIQQWPAYDLLISTVPPTCNSSLDGEMGVAVLAGGNGTYSYQWNTGINGDYIDGLQGGLTYTVTVTDGQGCTGTKSRLLENPPAIVANIAPADALCNGTATGTATVTSVQNANGAVTYQWDANAMNQTTAAADSLAAGTYSVVVTDSEGCTGSGSVQIDEPAAIKADFTIVNNVCFGYEEGSVDLEVSGGIPGYQVQWSNGASTLKITDLAADQYYVTITDMNGCTKLDSAFVAAPERVDAAINVKDVSCFGGRDGSITVTPSGGTPPYQYSLDGDKYYGSSTLIALKAGDYQVFIKDAKGCIYQNSTTVNEPPQISVEILVWGLPEDEYMTMFGDSVPLVGEVTNGIGSITYFWEASYCGTLFENGVSDCDQTPQFNALWANPSYTNDYYLTVVDENGCEAEDHVQIHVKKERRVVVPTGFSPNNDGKNDLLPIHGKSGTMVKLFQVFDRWGELLFQDVDIPINDTTRGWDGTFKSKDMPPGVYVWYLEAEYSDGMKEAYRGETTLIR